MKIINSIIKRWPFVLRSTYDTRCAELMCRAEVLADAIEPFSEFAGAMTGDPASGSRPMDEPIREWLSEDDFLNAQAARCFFDKRWARDHEDDL